MSVPGGVDGALEGSVTATVNGEVVQLPSGTTIAALVDDRCPSPRGIAVARNGDLLTRSRWSATDVVDGDRLEIVTAAAGG